MNFTSQLFTPGVQALLEPALFADTKFPTIDHPHIFLRPIEKDDFSTWFAYLSLPVVQQHISWRPKSSQDLQEFISNNRWNTSNQQFKFAIADKDHGKLLGTIGFHSLSAAQRSVEIAYDLHPQYWGKGIMRSCCDALSNWALREAKLNRLQATVLEHNQASLKVLQNCGFQTEGLLRNYKVVDGVSRHYWMLSRIASDK